MTKTFSLILCTLFLLQGAWSSPAKSTNSENTDVKSSDDGEKADASVTVSVGTQLSNNMNENLLKALNNMRTGAMAISTPVIKFGADTMPSLFTTGVKTVAEAASKIADAKKKGFGKLLNGVANVAGGGAVLGSSIIGGNMQMIGSGFGVAGNLIEAAAKFGLNITGNLADTGALTNMVMATFTNAILEGAGKGMSVVGDGVTSVSKSSAKVIDAIGKSISHGIGNAQDTMTKWFKSGSAKFQDGAMTLTTAAQVNYYNALQWYLHNLLAMENIMDKLTETINKSSGDKTSSGEKEEEQKKEDTKDEKSDKQT